jgi:hypothetical protein
VNETFAQHFFPGQSAVGRRFGFFEESSRDIEIVGVVQDIKYHDLREETPRLMYLPAMQFVTSMDSLEVRTGGDPTAVVGQVRRGSAVSTFPGDVRGGARANQTSLRLT